MKIAVIEKCPSKNSFEFFDFEFDHLYLSSKSIKKLLVKNIDLDMAAVREEYDLIITVGAEPTKHVAKVNSVVNHNGILCNDKFIPIINPAITIFKPDQREALNFAITKIEEVVTGTYNQYKGGYQLIDRASAALEYIDKVLRADEITYIAVDTETAALYPRNGHCLGISISHRPGQGIYLLSDVVGENEQVEEKLQELFKKKKCVFHNAKFDMHFLKFWFGFKFYDWEDTMLMHYLLNENESHSLKFLAGKYTPLGNYEAELEEFKKDYCKKNKITQAEFSYEYIPVEIIYRYAAADTDATIRLYEKFATKIENNFKWIYNHLMKPALLCLQKIEDTGLPFNVEELKRAQLEYDSIIDALKDKLYEFPEVHEIEKEQGIVFNPNSVNHLRSLLYGKLGLPVLGRTAKGEASTAKEFLFQLEDMHPAAKIISEYKQKSKIKGTYLDKALINLDGDNRIRSNFNQHVTTSGRLSSSGKMNYQQFPRDDKTVKNCIQHPDPDYFIFCQD